MNHPHCCHYLPAVAPIAAPFHKSLVLDYYDGALAGVMQCGFCEQAYKFDLLDYGDGQTTRIISLASLPVEDFADLIETLVQTQESDPRWPVWCPIWLFPTEEAKIQADAAVSKALAAAGPPHWVIAIDPWIKQVLAAREISPDQTQTVSDWFDFLQISREDPYEQN